jgi:hypothetical protein
MIFRTIFLQKAMISYLCPCSYCRYTIIFSKSDGLKLKVVVVIEADSIILVPLYRNIALMNSQCPTTNCAAYIIFLAKPVKTEFVDAYDGYIEKHVSFANQLRRALDMQLLEVFHLHYYYTA